jgi:hypothetical protein
MHVILDGDCAGIYWDHEWIGDERETLWAATAFLALRGKVHLIYPTLSDYVTAHPSRKEAADDESEENEENESE